MQGENPILFKKKKKSQKHIRANTQQLNKILKK